MKHTKGPWKVGRNWEVYGADGYQVVDPTQGPMLSEKFNNRKDKRKHWANVKGAEKERCDDECLANANLISAAPELLASVRELLGDGPECDCGPEGHVCGWPKVQQNAERAISKAEGGGDGMSTM